MGMKGYKGFCKGLRCRGKQYAENTVFEENNAKICDSGMHFCENPLDVLDHYPLLDDNCEFNEFAEVEALADTKADDKKSKFCTTKLKIGAKLSLPMFIEAAVDFMIERMPKTDGIFASSGKGSQLASSGYGSQLASSGNDSKLASSGDYSQLASSGNDSKLASSGNYSKLASSGNYSKLASSGNDSKLASSGDYSKLASSGNDSKLASSGENSIVAGIGIDNIAKASKGNWIVLAEWECRDDGMYVPYCVKSVKVDGITIKADTFYRLENGKFVEVKDDES